MQESKKVASYFHRTADGFHALYNQNSGLKGWLNRTFRSGLYERVDLTTREIAEMESPTVLDVGCGSGRNSVIFVNAGGAEHLTGIDFSDRMLELAEEITREHSVADRCTFVNGDVFDYEPDERYDAVVALGVFDYVEDAVPLLKKMMEVSKGKVIGSFPGNAPVRSAFRKIRYDLQNCPLYFYDRQKLELVCQVAGLDDYRIIPYSSSGFLLVGHVDA